MIPLLEILIPYCPQHMNSANLLEVEFRRQLAIDRLFNECKVTTHPDMFGNRGKIRNYLLQNSTGEYVCFFDADDKPASDYIKRTLQALESKPDCCSLTGVITWDGENPEIFDHSIKYSAYKTNDTGEVKYEYTNERKFPPQFTIQGITSHERIENAELNKSIESMVVEFMQNKIAELQKQFADL